ncbi:trimethylamine monooxygenase-like [Mytilus trossulus]|uniref:trimethylamine monooxygenase-like n=1 Tax=Mytilus trossulus TaxID=6551 RepID=UPI003004225D
MASERKVCIIGAGPCGTSALFHFDQINDSTTEVICYEKSDKWLGLWNLTWMTGTDEYGEPCHGGMYKHMWSNGPKEGLEYPDYTFTDHFGKPIPSYPPRPVIRDYLEGRLVKKSKSDLKQFIKWTTVVRYVRYNTKSDDFTVTTEDIKTGHTNDTNFTHVIVAVGIYNSPDKPYFEGIETFPGRIIHSHDFRDATQFKGQRVLVVGAKNSAEDIALQCMKFGAKNIVTSYRSSPLNYNWPVGIEERPLVQKIDGKIVHFLDGSFTEVDSIILSTGYKYMFPFMENNLRPVLSNILYPAGLYKGSLWLQGGNRKLFYMGVQHHCFTFTMFDAQGLWICRYITDTLSNKVKSYEEMKKEEQKWLKRCNSLKDIHEQIDFQADFIKDLSDGTEYSSDAPKAKDFFHKWACDKRANIVTYRDQQYKSLYSGTETVPCSKPWFQNFDDSLNSFVNR